MLDQVLIRPELLSKFNNGDLAILDNDGTTLLSKMNFMGLKQLTSELINHGTLVIF